MPYFNYHAKIKNKIKNKELVKYEIVDEYNGISPAMLLYFKDDTIMPVREYRFLEYFELLKDYSFDLKV